VTPLSIGGVLPPKGWDGTSPGRVGSPLGPDYGARVDERRQGWWGIAFVVLLFVGGGMVSVPTADDSAARIVAFHDAHAPIVIVAQIIGMAALVPLLLLVQALSRRAQDPAVARWIVAAGIAVAVTQLATAIPPLVLAIGAPTADSAHTWTFAEDLADAALFAALGLLVLAVVVGRPPWLRRFGVVVAALAVARAAGSPLGVRALDVVAPLAFVAFVVALSVAMLRTPPVEAPA
jgi:hypothetical protein